MNGTHSRRVVISLLVLAISFGIHAGELYSDPIAGYSVSIPTGYRKLTEDETRDVFTGLSDALGKDAGERVRKRPPVWFIGPSNPKVANEHPPSFAIAFSENQEQIDPAQIPAYRDMILEKRKRDGDKPGDVTLSVIKVDGINALQEECDLLNRANQERSFLIRVAVPGKGKWYELVFNYSAEQNEGVRVALKEALATFKVMEHPPENVENAAKWLRVLYYTVGFGLVGVVLSFIMRKLGGEKDGSK